MLLSDNSLQRLTIDNLQMEDTAVYQCNISNNHGWKVANAYVKAYPLTLGLELVKLNITMSINDSTDLSCQFSGEPEPVVKRNLDGRTASKDDTKLPMNEWIIIGVSQSNPVRTTCIYVHLIRTFIADPRRQSSSIADSVITVHRACLSGSRCSITGTVHIISDC